jgi:hypothetical protein
LDAHLARHARRAPLRALLFRSRSSVLARAPSRFVSTEAGAEGRSRFHGTARSTNFIKEMTPTATFLGILVALTSVGVLFYSRITKLEADMIGVAATLKSDMAGTVGKLEERMLGIIKEVDAKNTGIKEAVDAKIIGFKEAADLKVRSSCPSSRARLLAEDDAPSKSLAPSP